MLQSDWDSWVSKHATLFGFTDANLRMLDAWRPIFDAAKYSVEDLQAATRHMSQHPPRFATEHLAAIHGVVRERRAVEYRREFESYEKTHGTCHTCGGTGFVSVPHLKGVVNGEWRPVRATRHRSSFYTQSVLCNCALGKWKRDHLGKNRAGEPRVMMDLNAYEANNPQWQEQMAAHNRRLLENASAVRTPKEAADFRRDVERLMASVGTDQGDAYEG